MSRIVPRRLFLRGAAGVAVGLPLLESFGKGVFETLKAVARSILQDLKQMSK